MPTSQNNNAAHSALVKEILQVCHVHHCFAFQTNVIDVPMFGGTGKRYRIRQGVKGQADILALVGVKSDEYVTGIISGQFIPAWIEAKTGRGEQSPFQKSFQSDVEARGHLYIVCRDTRELEKELWP